MDINELSQAELQALFDSSTPEEKEIILRYLEKEERYRKYTRIEYFEGDHWQYNAIKKGVDQTVRGVIAGNRLGKSWMGTYETSMHLTGRYPDDWEGYKFTTPINAIALGVDFNQMARPNAIQELLMGPPNDRGTGWIPLNDIVRVENRMGQSGAIAKVIIKHYDKNGNHDGESRLDFGAYSQGDESIMGSAYHWFYIDECPTDKTILEQCKKRQWSFKGKARGLCVFTPERGLNETVEAFWNDNGIHHEGLIHVTLWDSSLYTPEQKQAMNASVQPWQRVFSIEGKPSAGTGAIFAGIMKETILDNSFVIQDTWKRVSSIDFGFRDTNVIQFFAKDPNTKIIYMYDEICHNDTDAAVIAPQARARQEGYIQMVWPPDGEAEKGTGVTLMDIYKKEGVIATDRHAANYMLDPEGKDRSITAGLAYLRDLMIKGLFKVHPKCQGFLKEFDLYSYGENGKPIDKYNHSIDCCRYGTQAIERYGRTPDHFSSKVSQSEWDDYYDDQPQY